MDPLSLGIVVALMAGVAGGVINSMGTSSDINQQLSQLSDQYDYLKKNYTLTEEQRQLSYDTAQEEANKEADKTDRASTISEKSLNSQFNNELNNLILSQVADGTAFNNQAVTNGQTTGNALSTAAASGTRSSSMNTAIDLEAATNAAQLQLAEDQQRAGEDYQINNLLSQAAENTFSIGESRKNALDLRNQYLEGGSKYKAFKLEGEIAKNTYDYNMNSIQKEYKDLSDNRWKDELAAFFSASNTVSSSTLNWFNLG